MSYEGLGGLVEQIREASQNISAGDARMHERLDVIEKSVNEIYLKQGRPGAVYETKDEEVAERKSAIELCRTRRSLTTPRIDADVSDDYEPSNAEITDAMVHRKAIRSLIRYAGDERRLDVTHRKSLSAFSFGSTGMLLPPEMSTRVLRCIVDPTNIAGLVDRQNISSSSISFPIDNSTMGVAAWACDASCFANNPQPDLSEGLGSLNIKAESLRFVACATSDLLSDSAFDVENWLLEKVSEGFRNTLNLSILLGDGIGKPLGFLNPRSGIPICDTSSSTLGGQFTWQDLLLLKMEIPSQWQEGCSYLMNPRTAALLFTMSTADGRPLISSVLNQGVGFSFAGSPIVIATQMPDVALGSTPILFGNLRKTYTIVDRRATTMLVDNYTAGFCTLFKFEARCGGGITCPNASRLLRIH